MFVSITSLARYYDPYIGRFTQRDPIGDGVNWYAYTYNNPLKFVDPTGQLATITYFSGSGSDPSFSLFWDPDIEHFAFNHGSGVSWVSADDLVSLLVDFTPIIGDAKGFIEGVIGKNLLTGDPLSPVDRFLGLVLLTELRGIKKSAELVEAAIDAAGGLSKLGRKGKGRDIREVIGSESDAKAMFDALRGNNPARERKPGVFIAESKKVKGKYVTYRISDEGIPTVDVHGIEGKLRKIKFVEE